MRADLISEEPATLFAWIPIIIYILGLLLYIGLGLGAGFVDDRASV